MIQDIAPKKLNNQFDAQAKPQAEDFVLCIQDQTILVKEAGSEILFPKVMDFQTTEELSAKEEAFIYLFSIDEERFFLYQVEKENPITLDDFSYQTIRELRSKGLGPKYRNFAIQTGKHLADWYGNSRFCGRCGSRTVHSKKERCMICPECNYHNYPKIMPAVIVGVKNGDKLLLTKYARGFAHNALIAGFTEIGETAEETVAREVMEEAGIRVKNIRYYKTQPWGIANDLLLGYYCEVDGDTTIHMDASELKYAQWVAREEIVLQPDDYSLTNEMMRMFKEGIEK